MLLYNTFRLLPPPTITKLLPEEGPILMDALTQSQQPFITKRSTNQYEPIPLAWRRVVELHLQGLSNAQIAALTDYTVNSVYRILHHKDVIQVRQQLLDGVQQEFEALFSKTVNVIRNGLDDADPNVNLSAADKWLKANGKYKGDKGTVINNITAEDVVMQILNGDVTRNE